MFSLSWIPRFPHLQKLYSELIKKASALAAKNAADETVKPEAVQTDAFANVETGDSAEGEHDSPQSPD